MAALICDACGAPLVSGKDGLMKCNYCGLLHSPERVAQKVQEIKGVVEVTKGNAEKERLLQNAVYFYNKADFASADKTFKTLLFEYPTDHEVNKEYWRYKMRVGTPISKRANLQVDEVVDLVSTLSNAHKYGLDTSEFAELIIKSYKLFKGYDGSYNSWHGSLDDKADDYGLLKLWKLKSDIIYETRQHDKTKSDLSQAINHHEQIVKINSKMKREKTLEIIRSIIFAMCLIANIFLITKSWEWAFALLISLPLAFAGVLPLFISDKRFPSSKSADKEKSRIEQLEKRIETENESLVNMQHRLSETEPKVFQRIRSDMSKQH